MEDKVYFGYVIEDNKDNAKEIFVEIGADVNLTELFARFIDFTRMIGYYPESWRNVIKDFANELEDNDIDAFELANCIMYDC